MSALASIRPDDWNLSLFIHVAGAMVLVGAVLTAAVTLKVAGGDARLLRFGHRSLLYVGLPSFIAMRVGAELIADKEGFNESGASVPDWLGIGYIIADAGALLLIIALITGAIGVKRIRDGNGGERLVKTTSIISIVLLAAYVIAVWAMSAKPG